MKAKILVIEDEAAINDMICMGLEATGYETEAFFDGALASEALIKNHVRLWILCCPGKMALRFF